MDNLIGRLAVVLHQAIVEPLLVLTLRRDRLRTFGHDAMAQQPIAVDWHRAANCRQPCPLHADRTPKLLRRYAQPDGASGRLRLTPMIIALDDLPDGGTFDRLLKQRSSRTPSKLRRAERLGYRAHPFMLASHVEDMHAIRTSTAFRAAGPVLDRWFLRPHHIATPAPERLAVIPPCCSVHWTIWWGLFAPEPGHRQAGVQVDERLVAYVKVMRIGDVVHYTEIMGHRDRLGDNVMLLLHHAIVRWLIEAPEPAARGARVLLYGAAEHGGAGLLTWKKRAGFRPGKLRVVQS